MSKKVHFPFAILGKKVGMTQIFSETGDVIPVTALQVGPCVVLQKKTKTTDGYNAIQLGFDDKKKQRVKSPEAGHSKKANTAAKRFVREVRMDDSTINDYEIGTTLTVADLRIGDHVDVSGISIGKGFAGVMKRHGFGGAPKSHSHEFFRHGGSIGNRSDPGKVFKNKAMPGQMGNEMVTVENLDIVAVQPEENVILVRGAVPGSKNTYIFIKSAVKGNFAARKPGGSVEAEAPAVAAE